MSVLEDKEDFELFKKVFILSHKKIAGENKFLLIKGKNTPEALEEEIDLVVQQDEENKIKVFIKFYKQEKYDNIDFSSIQNKDLFQEDGLLNIYLINAIRFIQQSTRNIIIERNILGSSFYINKDYTNIIYNIFNILDISICEISDFNLREIGLLRLFYISIYKIAEILLKLHYAANEKSSFRDIKDDIDYIYYLIQALEVHSRSCILKAEFINEQISSLYKMDLTKQQFAFEREKIVCEIYNKNQQTRIME